jgi:hypothetical protein
LSHTRCTDRHPTNIADETAFPIKYLRFLDYHWRPTTKLFVIPCMFDCNLYAPTGKRRNCLQADEQTVYKPTTELFVKNDSATNVDYSTVLLRIDTNIEHWNHYEMTTHTLCN